MSYNVSAASMSGGVSVSGFGKEKIIGQHTAVFAPQSLDNISAELDPYEFEMRQRNARPKYPLADKHQLNTFRYQIAVTDDNHAIREQSRLDNRTSLRIYTAANGMTEKQIESIRFIGIIQKEASVEDGKSLAAVAVGGLYSTNNTGPEDIKLGEFVYLDDPVTTDDGKEPLYVDPSLQVRNQYMFATRPLRMKDIREMVRTALASSHNDVPSVDDLHNLTLSTSGAESLHQRLETLATRNAYTVTDYGALDEQQVTDFSLMVTDMVCTAYEARMNRVIGQSLSDTAPGQRIHLHIGRTP